MTRQEPAPSELPLTRFTPESRLRHPLRLLGEMVRDLKASRELGWRLFVRDVSAQYRQTALGYFWAVFPPLVTTLVMILLRSATVIDAGETGNMPYPAYVMIGTVFFQVFVDALNAPLKAVNESKAILTKINLPREAFILAGIGQVLFSFAIKLLLLGVVLAWFRVPLGATAPLVLLPLLGLLLLGTMLGVLLSPLGLLFTDIQSALLIFTSGLVFVTPVGFPAPGAGALGAIMRLNPLTPLLQAVRDLLAGRLPADPGLLLLLLAVVVLLLLVGWVIYRLALPIIIERIGM